ncbi:hypothetical protein BDQ17DRAFT_1437111 [Cyathus striatus]|nr:hypothetical protein BDQ17DRAFT_1437111 [Cyathus striatus]
MRATFLYPASVLLSVTIVKAAPAPVPADILNLVNAKYIPISALSEGNTSADKIQISDVNENYSHGPSELGHSGANANIDEGSLLKDLLHLSSE